MSSLETAAQRQPRGLPGETLTHIATMARSRLEATLPSDFGMHQPKKNIDGALVILDCMISQGIHVWWAKQFTWRQRDGYGDELAVAMFHKAHQLYQRELQKNAHP